MKNRKEIIQKTLSRLGLHLEPVIEQAQFKDAVKKAEDMSKEMRKPITVMQHVSKGDYKFAGNRDEVRKLERKNYEVVDTVSESVELEDGKQVTVKQFVSDEAAQSAIGDAEGLLNSTEVMSGVFAMVFDSKMSKDNFVATHKNSLKEEVHLDEMKRSDEPFTVVAIKNNKVVGKAYGILHDEIEDAIQSMKEDKKGAKISVESKSGRIVHTESVQLDETVKIMFKGFGKEVTEFQQKLKKFGQVADYNIMMQNFKNHSNVGDGLYFTDTSKGLGFEIHSVRDRMMGDKIRKLGDSQDLGGGKTVTLIAIKEDVQLGEEVIKARVAFFGRPNQNNSDMRDAKKKNMFVDAKDVDAAKGKMFDVTFNSRRQFNRFESEYDFLMVKVFEDVQLDETMTARDLESMIKGLKKGAKQEIADVLNDMDLSGYGDYEARVDNVHKFKTKDLFNAMKKVMKLESLKMRLDERPDVPTYVIDRKTKKIVHGPTDTGDAKLYLNKQIQPRKFMIRQIRGAAKKVGDTV